MHRNRALGLSPGPEAHPGQDRTAEPKQPGSGCYTHTKHSPLQGGHYLGPSASLILIGALPFYPLKFLLGLESMTKPPNSALP